MRKWTGIVLLCGMMMLTGCGNSTYDKAVEQGKLAMANGEYDKAMASFELALNEKKDAEVQGVYDQLEMLKTVQKAYSDQNWDEVLSEGESLLQIEGLSTMMSEEVGNYVTEAQEQKQSQTIIAECSAKLEEAKKLVEGKKYDEALSMISEIKQNEIAAGNEEIMTKINAVVAQVADLKAAETAAKEKAEKEAKEKAAQEAAEKAAQEEAALREAWSTPADSRIAQDLVNSKIQPWGAIADYEGTEEYNGVECHVFYCNEVDRARGFTLYVDVAAGKVYHEQGYEM